MDLYRQKLQVHFGDFWNGQLPENQRAKLARVEGVHGYGTKSAGDTSVRRDQGSVGYAVSGE